MSTEHPTRRSFLMGKVKARDWTAPTDGANDDRPGANSQSSYEQSTGLAPVAASPSALLVSVRRRAMACEFEVQLAAARDDDSMEHVFSALDLVEAIESQLTVYRDNSEIAAINRRAANEPLVVEPRLFVLLQEAARLHAQTGGALDITSGPLSQAWGFSRREGRVPSDAEVAAALQRVGMQQVMLDERQQTIAFRQPGVNINFNSLGKGYALDRMAELLHEHFVDDYLLHGGKSSVLARGDQPGIGAGAGWCIGIRHPLRPAERLAEICLRDQALSTSGSGTQFFIRRGRRYGHILDPRTGRPAEGLLSATAVAQTATEAEGLSTAFYVMGPDAVEDYCERHPHVAAILVAPGMREGDVKLYAFGLDEDAWQQLAER